MDLETAVLHDPNDDLARSASERVGLLCDREGQEPSPLESA